MKLTDSESNLIMARMERTLLLPLGSQAGILFVIFGAIMALMGFGLWVASSNWLTLLGGNLVYLGTILTLLGLETQTCAGRLSLTPFTGVMIWFAIRRFFTLSMILRWQDRVWDVWKHKPFDFYACSAVAELVGAVGVFGFWWGWRLARRKWLDNREVEPLNPPFDRSLWGCYFISLMIYLLNMAAPEVVGRLGSFGGQIIRLSAGVAFAIGIVLRTSLPISSLIYSVLLCFPFALHVMGFGMKSSFVSPFMPAFYIAALRSIRLSLFLAVPMVVFLLVFVFPYVKQFRQEAWTEQRKVQGEVLAKEVWHTVREDSLKNAAMESWNDFQGRFSSLGVTGAIVDLVRQEGVQGPIFLVNLPYAFIPRLLWPGKPAFEPAAWLSDKLYGITTTATAFHLPIEWYWMFGWPGAFFGMGVLGFGSAWVHRYLLVKSMQASVFFAGWFAFFLFIANVEEVRANSTFITPVVIIAASWMVYGMTRLMLLGGANKSAAAAHPALTRKGQSSRGRR